jgi:membrane associated rhomboid family serine protease
VIPLRDRNPVTRPPVLVWSLVAANITVFLFEVYLRLARGPGLLEAFMNTYGAVPARFAATWDITPLLSSMFLHGGLLHLIGNLWFLWIFGDNVEDRLGRVRFLLLYFGTGLVAALTQIVLAPQSTVPMVGASGAIAGVLAAYVRLFPRARVLTLIPIFIFIQFVELPAFLFIFVWFGLQLVQGTLSLGTLGANTGGTAFFAHIGGFVAGLLFVRYFTPLPGGQKRFRSAQGRKVVYRPRGNSDHPPA